MWRSSLYGTSSQSLHGSSVPPGRTSHPKTARSSPPYSTVCPDKPCTGRDCWLPVLPWHRALVKRHHAARSRPERTGRPRTVRSIRLLALRLAKENPNRSYRRTHGELATLGISFAAPTIGETLRAAGIDPAPQRSTTCTAPELITVVLTCDLSGWPGCGKIRICAVSFLVSDHDPSFRLDDAAGA